MSVVTTNVKVTDLGSKEADEEEVWKPDVWTQDKRKAAPKTYIRLHAKRTIPFMPQVGRSLNIETASPSKAASPGTIA